MSKDVTVANNDAYTKLIESFHTAFSAGEGANLMRYHKFGELFAEFCGGMDGKKYGAKTIETLIADLNKTGLLSELKDPKRFLYWAKNLYDTYVDPKHLLELAKKGFTLNHAKLLFSVESEVMDIVSSQMIGDNGRIVPTRELADIIRGVSKSKAIEQLQEVIGESPQMAINDKSAAAAVASPPTAASQPSAPDKADKPAKAEKADKAPKNDTPATGSPFKVVKGLSKTADKLLTGLADGFLAMNAVGKTGFDSDKANANFRTTVSDLHDSLSRMQEPIAELLKVLEAYRELE